MVQFFPWFKFHFICLKLIIIHYHTPKQRKIKFKPWIKFNHKKYMLFRSQLKSPRSTLNANMILKIIKGRGRPKYNEIERSLLQVCLISPSLLLEWTDLVRFVRKLRIRPLVSRWQWSRCGVSWVIYILFVEGWGRGGAEMWRFMLYPYFRISLPFLTFSNS